MDWKFIIFSLVKIAVVVGVVQGIVAYSVLAERKEQGQGWLQPQLVEMLLNWPDPAPDAQIPFTLMILRGKAYLRMQYEATGSAVLEHVVDIFELACELGLTSIPEDEEDAA